MPGEPKETRAMRRAEWLKQMRDRVMLIAPYYEGGLVHEIARALQAVPARIKTIGVPLTSFLKSESSPLM
jgi:hypothetical protein